MNLDLSGKRAVVCGSTQGIGRAAAEELAGLGASITLLARNESKLVETRATLGTRAGQDHHYLVADFSQPEQVKRVIEEYASKQQVEILVNNTGGPPAGPVRDAQVEDFTAAFQAHLLCNHILAQALIPSMQAAGYGRIINIISTSVKVPIRGLGVSNTIRGAVANWSKTLSLELAPYGITVNNVLPGASMTGRLRSLMESKAAASGKSVEDVQREMEKEIPAGRISHPSEVAAAVAFLATPAAGYINGINIPVDGGRTGSL